MCWDGIEQRGAWHETEHGYLWILVGMDLNPVDTVVSLSKTPSKSNNLPTFFSFASMANVSYSDLLVSLMNVASFFFGLCGCFLNLRVFFFRR